jgi:hypothetical protein
VKPGPVDSLNAYQVHGRPADLVKEARRERSQCHRRSRVTGAGAPDRVRRQESHRIDRVTIDARRDRIVIAVATRDHIFTPFCRCLSAQVPP